MSKFRPITRVLRRQTKALRDWVRGRADPARVQRSVPLRPEDKTDKRRRMHVLVDLVHEQCPKAGVVVVEVGAKYGKTSAHLLKYCPQVKVLHAVDIARPDAGKDRITKLDRLNFILGWSHEVAKGFADGSVDLVFVDADHKKESVLQDLGAWFPKVKKGGIIAGHDYGASHHPGVKEAVDGFFNSHPNPVHLDANKVWWTTK